MRHVDDLVTRTRALLACTILLLVGLAGCAAGHQVSFSRVSYPDGRSGFQIACPHDPGDCDDEAARLCDDYDVVSSHTKDHMQVVCAAAGKARAVPAKPKKPAPPSTEEIAKRALQSTVLVETPEGFGTGFVVPGGMVATNLHVVAGQSKVLVVSPSGQKSIVQDIRGIDQLNDVVLLDAHVNLKPLAFSDAKEQPGSPVVVVGNPEGLQGTVSSGVVSSVRQHPTLDHELLQITAAISPGSSGGPVLDKNGKVIGVVRMFVTKGQNLNFAVPIRYVEKLLQKNQRPIDPKSFAEMTAPEPAKQPPAAQRSAGTVSANTGQTRPSFPASVGGFPLGIGVARASQLCGGQLARASGGGFWCPFLPIGMPFAKAGTGVSLGFEGGSLTNIMLRGKSWDGALRSLAGKHGPPDFMTLRVKGHWTGFRRENGAWTNDGPVKNPDLHKQSAVWHLAGGYIDLFLIQKNVSVLYMTERAQQLFDQNY